MVNENLLHSTVLKKCQADKAIASIYLYNKCVLEVSLIWTKE